jgi:phenylalanyl-tRNA synthetase beta chain
MQDLLKSVGLRPISALVDITNFMSLDACRPLHVFDADKIKGNIKVRQTKKGETLEALNDKTIRCTMARSAFVMTAALPRSAGLSAACRRAAPKRP